MSKRHKGNLAVAQVIADLTAQDLNVSIPLADNLPYDLIVESNGIPLRFQVKHARSNGKVVKATLQSSWASRKKNHHKPRTPNSYDVLACWCKATGKCYYVNASTLSHTCLHLRLIPSASFNNKPVRMAVDFEDPLLVWNR